MIDWLYWIDWLMIDDDELIDWIIIYWLFIVLRKLLFVFFALP